MESKRDTSDTMQYSLCREFMKECAFEPRIFANGTILDLRNLERF